MALESVVVEGLEVCWRREGAGPPLVLVHGAVADCRTWEPQLVGLSDELTVIAWDEPGCGRSSPVPDGFELSDYVRCLAAVIEAAAGGSAVVGGLSWGGTVVLELYRHRPDLVAGLALIDTYAGWRGSLRAGEVTARLDALRRTLEQDDFDPAIPGLFAGDPGPEALALIEQGAATVSPHTMRTELELMGSTDNSDVLPTIAVPTLLIWGERDVRSPLRVAHQFEQAIPGAELVVIPDCGHVSNLERPEAVNEALRRFCRSVFG